MKKAKKIAMNIALLLSLSLVALVAWAFFWPETFCSDPGCSRKRFDLFVELDAFRDIDPIPLEVETEDGLVSARRILRTGGFDVTIQTDDLKLPYSPESGPLDRADLYQYALAWRSLAPPSRTDAQMYALVAPSIVSDRGERLFGLMFDSAGREGIAIAPRQTERTFQAFEAESIPLMQLRTFVHEMLHSLNRRHLDAVQMPDGRITLEAPTRCLMEREGNDWRLTEPPLMALSPWTIEFFQLAPARDVLPGTSNAPFAASRGSANECADIRSNRYQRTLSSRWEFAKRRVFEILGIGSADAQDTVDEEAEENPLRLDLRIQAQEAAYPLGYPIAIRILVRNDSDYAVALKDRVAPAYGLVQIQYRLEGDDQWRAFRPVAMFEPASDEGAMLEPGETTEQTAAIYFGDDGWTFPEAGTYELRGTLKTSDDVEDVVSNTLKIRIETPRTDAERETLRPLLDSAGMLDMQVGRWLVFGGRISDAQTQAAVLRAIEEHPQTALGSALRLTLASQRLRPPIDPLTGERPEPDLKQANEILRDTCTDSGVAALKHEMLMRLKDESAPLPSGLKSNAEAWDGITARGEVIATYSDPVLRAADVSLHFCDKETFLRSEARREALELARRLKQEDAKRIVVVGHSDRPGSCQANDELAMQRANTVRRVFLQAGFTAEQIEAVSLGKRRPLDLSGTDTAKALNRRVELLVEREAPHEPPEQAEEIAEAGESPETEEPSDTEASEEPETEREEPEEEVTVRRVLPTCK